jgi:hypothetical protein
MNKSRLLSPSLIVGAVLAANVTVAAGAAPHTQYSADIGVALHAVLGPAYHTTAIAEPGSTVPLPAGTRLDFTTTGSFTIGKHFVLRIKPFSGIATPSGRKITVRFSKAERHLIRAAARRYNSTHADLTTSTTVVGSRVRNETTIVFRVPGL